MISRWAGVPILLFGLAIVLPAENSQASLIHMDTFYLNIFTDNGDYADDPAVSLFVEVFRYDNDDELVYFEFHNDSDDVESSIARIYFDDDLGLLSGPPDIVNGPGTIFSLEGSPPNLPAGNDLSPPFQKPPDFMATADEPPPTNGVNPSTAPDPDEWVAIIFDLVGGHSVSEVVEGLEDGSLRIGVHVIAFPDGSSESASAPEPATMGLMLMGGLMLLLGRGKRR
ncbi:MAG: PEP-CTERM sorting domain-containing protein [Phycisphaerae bacterium]|nr:PEP-CTERM sorting domain-containing protein [Phycisphaerae bacterium]